MNQQPTNIPAGLAQGGRGLVLVISYYLICFIFICFLLNTFSV